jgi:serine/threonine protein kinase
MSRVMVEPRWTGEKCNPGYIWEDAPQQLAQHGRQASHISLMTRRRRGKGSKPEPELFVCKWYATSGIEPTKVNGHKYIYREWQVLSSIRHPNILRYEDFAYDPTGPRLARLFTEYCAGGDLSQFERPDPDHDDSCLSYEKGAQVLLQLACALLYIHHGVFYNGAKLRLADAISLGDGSKADEANGQWTTILHRDIKPANGEQAGTGRDD